MVSCFFPSLKCLNLKVAIFLEVMHNLSVAVKAHKLT
jgi:hypothetical protein